jgi:hypothetical protein
MRWLSGLSPWTRDKFDKWFAASLDVLAKVLIANRASDVGIVRGKST